MDHNESIRKLEYLLLKESEHAHELATELETLASALPNGHSRHVAHEQMTASYKQAKGLRELAQRVKEG